MRALGFLFKMFYMRFMTKVYLAFAEISPGSVRSSARHRVWVRTSASYSGSEYRSFGWSVM
jgi:hypothetical protein